MKWPDELIFIPNSLKIQNTTTVRMDRRVCVITGATSGVGYHAAEQLAACGAQLILVCRNAEKGAKVKSEFEWKYKTNVQIIKADFSHLSEVRKAATSILEEYPRIDVLINNAGIHNTKRNITMDGHETVFHVNHLASFLFTRLLLPKIQASAPARIIQINSQGHRFGGLDLNDLHWEKRKYHGLKGYGASKVAQLLTVWELADHLKGSGVTINAMHPGAVRTNIGMNNNLLYQWYQRYLLWPLLKDPKISGEAIYYLAAAPEMAEVSGRFFNLTIDEKPAVNALDRDLGKQVWQVSEKLTGLESTLI